jgi:hypothetical protein
MQEIEDSIEKAEQRTIEREQSVWDEYRAINQTLLAEE